MDVDLIRADARDIYVIEAMRVSTKGAKVEEYNDVEAIKGRINWLMKNRHGSPFESNSMTFRVTAPIFVWREWHRHRIGLSYNEESGRYKVLDPVFYVPSPERKLVQEGKPGSYIMVPGSQDQHSRHLKRLVESYKLSYSLYLESLEDNVAKESARVLLPVAIYSTCYVTLNARSAMAFLSLRTTHENAAYPSTPQREIEMCAEKVEAAWAHLMPITAAAFTSYGRVAP